MVDGRDDRPLVGPRGFLFDERRERHDVARRHVARGGSARSGVSNARLNSLTIVCTVAVGARAARQRVRVGKQVALERLGVGIEVGDERCFPGRRAEVGRRAESALARRSSAISAIVRPSGNVSGRVKTSPRASRADHLGRRRRLREAVLARLQLAIGARQPRGEAERPRIGHDAGGGQARRRSPRRRCPAAIRRRLPARRSRGTASRSASASTTRRRAAATRRQEERGCRFAFSSRARASRKS